MNPLVVAFVVSQGYVIGILVGIPLGLFIGQKLKELKEAKPTFPDAPSSPPS